MRPLSEADLEVLEALEWLRGKPIDFDLYAQSVRPQGQAPLGDVSPTYSILDDSTSQRASSSTFPRPESVSWRATPFSACGPTTPSPSRAGLAASRRLEHGRSFHRDTPAAEHSRIVGDCPTLAWARARGPVRRLLLRSDRHGPEGSEGADLHISRGGSRRSRAVACRPAFAGRATRKSPCRGRPGSCSRSCSPTS